MAVDWQKRVTSSAKTADDYLAGLERRITAGKAVKVGFLEGATGSDGQPLAMRAAVNNFGGSIVTKADYYGNVSRRVIPPRPFFSNMVAEDGPRWGDALGRLMVANNNDSALSLAQMGEVIAGQLRLSILNTNDPPLAATTIARKGFEKPLVDTGEMFNGIDYEVERSDES